MKEAEYVLTQEWLEERLVFWQTVFSMQDWAFSITWAGPTELVNTYADHKFDLLAKRGAIRVRSEALGTNDNEKFDPEECIVHELIHPLLEQIASVSDVTFNNVVEEQFINSMSKPLVFLRRMVEEADNDNKNNSTTDDGTSTKRPRRDGKSSRKKPPSRRKRKSGK